MSGAPAQPPARYIPNPSADCQNLGITFADRMYGIG